MAVGATGKAAGLLLLLVIFHATCGQNGRIDRLATYLQEEKRLRENLTNPVALNHSLDSLRHEYSINTDVEWSRLGANPDEWIRLLRKLRRE